MTEIKRLPALTLILLVLIYGQEIEGRKVLLQDINVITLNRGQMTTARRSSPVAQLKCTGGSAGCRSVIPQTVQCYNRGWDGYDIQWECKTDMDKRYRFGQIVVSCEGYEYADDPYILAGSCGLEYDIDYVNQKGSGSYFNHYSSKHESGFGFGSIFTFLFVIMIIFFVYRTCFATPTNPSSFPGGAQSGSTPSAPPPPYGFRSDYCSGQDAPPPYSSTSHSNTGQQPGFFSGLASGAFLGYLFGNRGGYRSNSYYNDGYQRDWFGSPTGYHSGPSSSFSSSETRTASGFGGTKRR
ncbi:store-operated calcium entry-associated regulatory factor [Octopus sinensis]|uniref:Store-operated calcium entry-associated regulatory factor n=1 Tax=Octopus sinensis TaxID=2607531 RepID=A0A6P7TD17_9MOLL|nr:store-operated calcium entry-associated regulatory factor [Octopus sinensis]